MGIEALLREEKEKENAKLKLVVNHAAESEITTDLNVVNNPTAEIDLFTTEPEKRGKQSDKKTKDKNVVNHKQRDWSTTEKRRGKYSGAVESFRTSEDFKRKVKVFCAENDLDKQDFYRLVVNHYFETVVNHKDKHVVNNSTLDDLKLITLFKTKPLIVNLYLRYNSIFNEKTKWTAKDDDAGQSVNDLDLQIIELGIIQTQFNKKFEGKVNSFSYYLPEIRTFAELNPDSEVLKPMLDINRKRWQQATGKTLDLEFLNKPASDNI